MNMTQTLKQASQQLTDEIARLKETAAAMNGQSRSKEALLQSIENLKNARDKIEMSIKFTYFGQKNGGLVKNERKAKAVRENGKKGGRPSSRTVMQITELEKEVLYKVTFNKGPEKQVEGSFITVRDLFPPKRYKWSEEAESAWEKYISE